MYFLREKRTAVKEANPRKRKVLQAKGACCVALEKPVGNPYWWPAAQKDPSITTLFRLLPFLLPVLLLSYVFAAETSIIFIFKDLYLCPLNPFYIIASSGSSECLGTQSFQKGFIFLHTLGVAEHKHRPGGKPKAPWTLGSA